MTEKTIELLNGLLNLAIYTMYIALPIIVILVIMYYYQKYSKYREKEIKEAERIIVKKNEQIITDTTASNELLERKKQLSVDVLELEARKKELKKELGEEPEAEEPKAEEITIDYEQLTINELQEIAKQRGIKRYSRLKKAELIKALGN